MRLTFDEWWIVVGYKLINQGFVDAAGTAIIKEIAANAWAASQDANRPLTEHELKLKKRADGVMERFNRGEITQDEATQEALEIAAELGKAAEKSLALWPRSGIMGASEVIWEFRL